MELYIIRHAWAEQRDDEQWPDDGERPLTKAGRQRFARVVEQLALRGVAPEVVATSPLARCVETTQVLVDGLDEMPEVVQLDELLPGSDLQGLIEFTAGQIDRAGSVAWVGHAPDVSLLTAELIGGAGGWIRFAKGSVAAIRFLGLPAAGNGELRWLATAKVLGC